MLIIVLLLASFTAPSVTVVSLKIEEDRGDVLVAVETFKTAAVSQYLDVTFSLYLLLVA
jgi:hypothetical protein